MNLCSRTTTLALFCLLAPACAPDEPSRIPKTLRIGVLPGESPAVLKARFTPLADYLAAQLNIATELIIPKDYAALVLDFGAGKIDLAFFGGLTFLYAEKLHGAVPLVLRDTDLHFQSTYIIQPDLKAQRLEDCGGLRIAFGSEQSTSGHLMPRHFMQERGIDVESFFSEVIYSGSHDRTLELVASGQADLGVLSKQVIAGLLQLGAIDQSRVRVLEESPQFPDYVWAVPPDLDLHLRRRVRATFLELLPDSKENSEILSRLQAGHFLPATLEDFRKLRTAAESLGTVFAWR